MFVSITRNLNIQGRLLALAALFLFLYSLILSLSPLVRARSWDADLRWEHWLGFLSWAMLLGLAHWQVSRRLPESDPLLLPLAALLSGWGLLTIWRLDVVFGLRQTAWLAVGTGILIGCLRLESTLNFLRRYRYIWLLSGLALTGLTLIFGVNPLGAGPRLWLGCCGFYFQPSEPLKLLLVIYLAAYLADRIPSSQRLTSLLLPTLLLAGIALLILVVQRDLGTASIFIFIYATMLYLATGRMRFGLASALLLLLAGSVGYAFVDVIRTRIDIWLNPWADPSGSGYQIVQSLMAVANGGLPGRGPGIGFPSLVPVAISDFIFSAIAEEGGLLLTIPLMVLLAALAMRGFRASVGAAGNFRRLLAGGIAAYFGAQSIFIIGGNLRLLPLTGVTLPFISYGGSSLVTSFVALVFVLHISSRGDDEPAPLPRPVAYRALSAIILAGLLAASVANFWWAIVRSPDLLTRTDNPRRTIADLYVRRGSLLDRNNRPINKTVGSSGEYYRTYDYPQLGATIGFTDAVFGQSGLEAGLDPLLRGLQGNPAFSVWWNHLLYGFPPPGLDMRTSLDLSIQEAADAALGDHTGAAVLIDARRGEILAMASHPSFDPGNLAQDPSVMEDPASPLVNRATQGEYAAGSALRLFEQAGTIQEGLPLNATTRRNLYEKLGFFGLPALPLAAAPPSPVSAAPKLSPLKMALGVAALSSGGTRPPAWIALAADTPAQGWVILPASGDAQSVFSSEAVTQAIAPYRAESGPYWEFIAGNGDSRSPVTWYLAGTLPDWPGTPLAAVVAVEENNRPLAREIGRALISAAIQP